MNLIDQIPASIEWRVYSGDTATITIIISDENDQPIDMTDYTVTSEIRKNVTDANPDSTITVNANSNGIVSLTIPDTSILAEYQYFDIQTVDNNSGVVNTILKGTIIKEQDVTK